MGTRLATMARMRLEYDEARKRIQFIQGQLADLEEKVTPGQAESDKDRYNFHCIDIPNLWLSEHFYQLH